MNDHRMEVLRLGREVDYLSAIPEPRFNEAEDILSLRERVQGIEKAQERLTVEIK